MRAAGIPEIDRTRLAPQADLGATGSRHAVQFYGADSFLLDAVSRFVGGGLEAGGGGVVIATPPHLAGIEERLGARGLDLARARAEGRYVALDAAETLSRFMDGGWPDEARFAEVMNGVLGGETGGARPQPRVFGEMVALLFAEGQKLAAGRLEELWNGLVASRGFSLLCGYPMRSFSTAADGAALAEISAAHAAVLPAEGYAELATADERLRTIASLQQKAAALEAEVEQRRELESLLRRREEELSRLLEREQEARAAAEELARSKDEFLATLSHELRTPLTAMLGWVRMLRSGQLPPARAAYALEVVERNAQAQARLVEDLLDVSRVITGRLQLDLRQVELGDVVRGVVETLRPTAEAKGVRLELWLDPTVGPLAGDPDRLQQVVWNLLSNGVKYTHAGGRVEVRLSRTPSGAEITVTDTGIGIEGDFLPRLFERFSQAAGGPSRAHGGLGLGLAIVRHLVELHGGSVRASSAGEGHGATFVVSLPLPGVADPEPPVAVPIAAEPAERPPGQSGRSLPRLAGVRVLVVDDEPDARALFVAMLEQCGAEVVAAGSAREAREALARLTPDVLISDIGMAGESGYELIESVRRAPTELARVPAVAVTAYARTEDRERARAAGFELHVAKPIEPEELARVVERVARRPVAAA